MKSESTEAFIRGVDFSQECLAPRGCQVGSAGRATTTSYGTARDAPTNFGKIPNMEKCTAVHCEGEADDPDPAEQQEQGDLEFTQLLECLWKFY